MTKIGSPTRPLRVAVLGAGPAGFFATEALFKQNDVAVSVDVFDQLPAPYGLVRYGVAPDHDAIKKIEKKYEKTASDPRFRFFGNVEFGKDLRRDELRRHYDQIIYATGAQSDRALGIPGEDLEGSYSATEFVAWYNGHPDYKDRRFDLSNPGAVVVGVGNVAMDAARILAKSRAELATTDIADHALDALGESKVTNVHVLGRRGPVQAKFTPAEIREFGDLAVANPIVRADELALDPASEAALAEDRIVAGRNVETLRSYLDRDPGEKARRVFFRFCVSPVEILPGPDGRVGSVRVVRNVLEPTDSGYINARPTTEFETIECGLVLRSVGYRGVALPDVAFDDRKGIIRNADGRVLDAQGAHVAGEYATGWIKRGPSGVIGTNKTCARATVALMLEDLPGTAAAPEPSPDAIVALLEQKAIRYVTFEQWKRIDAHEVAAGAPGGRPRQKIVDRDAMLALAARDAS